VFYILSSFEFLGNRFEIENCMQAYLGMLLGGRPERKEVD
jgi:hypothetical protein